MAFTFYASTDNSAPVLNGQADTLVALLDAILVNGYGIKPGAGWTKAFSSGTSKAVYLNAATAVARRYFRVVDGTSAGRVRGYKTMTDVDNGTVEFPLSLYVSGDGNYIHKSSTADSVTRAWVAAADERTLVLCVKYDNSNVLLNYLGDGDSLVAGDTNFSVLGCNYGSATTNSSMATLTLPQAVGPADSSNHGLFCSGMPGVDGAKYARLACASNQFGSIWDVGLPLAGVGGGLEYPNIDGAIHLNPLGLIHYVSSSRWQLHGKLRFLYGMCHPASSFSDGDTFSGTGALSGKTFRVLKSVITYTGYSSSSVTGIVALVTSNPD